MQVLDWLLFFLFCIIQVNLIRRVNILWNEIFKKKTRTELEIEASRALELQTGIAMVDLTSQDKL